MSLFLQRLMGVALLTGVVVLGTAVAAPPVQPVAKVDLERYAGTWYELARLPNRFQEQCAGDVSATYTPNPDGTVGVTNRCRKANGDVDRTDGEARPAPGDASGARLEVSFLPDWLQWFPWGRGDYWVVMLDPEYRYAVVSEPGREFMWILSRTPQMEDVAYEVLLDQLRVAGYPVDQLVRTAHSTAKVAAPAERLQRLVWRRAGASKPLAAVS